MVTAIEFQNIKKSYGENLILNDFNLKIEKGDFLTIIGSSGCGKTTLLKMINGLVIPDDGKVFLEGNDISQEDVVKLRRSIGYSIQGTMLFPHITIEENISYVPDLMNTDKEETKKAVDKWLSIVGLDDDLLSRYPHELSGGQKQRVGIARALAASPHILLMDEPFGAVDEITRAQLQKEIKKIHQKTGITIIFITHDISEALFLGDKVLVMNDGKICQYDTPENILNNPATSYVENLIERTKLFMTK